MNRITKSLIATALAGSAIAGVNACGTPDRVDGARDDVRQVPPRTVTKTKTEYNNITKKSETKVTTKLEPGYWCVEVDNVNGDLERDDEWFRVTQEVYLAAKDADEGSPVSFSPLSSGC